jgi:hypothetical protein
MKRFSRQVETVRQNDLPNSLRGRRWVLDVTPNLDSKGFKSPAVHLHKFKSK